MKRSAVSLTTVSSMSQAKVFQLFQPIGGVIANPSNFCADAGMVSARAEAIAKFLIILIIGYY